MKEQLVFADVEIDFPVGDTRRTLSIVSPGRQLLREPYPYLHTVLASIVFSVDAGAVFLASFFASHFVLDLPLAGGLMPATAADFVAALAFVLLPKKRSLLAYPKIKKLNTQFRYLAPGFLMACVVNAGMLVALQRPILEAFRVAVLWGFAAAIALLIGRAAIAMALATSLVKVKLQRKIAIVGGGSMAFALAGRISADGAGANGAYGLMGIFNNVPGSAGLDGDLDDLVEKCRVEGAHAIILAMPDNGSARGGVRDVSYKLRKVLSDIYIVPNLVSGVDSALPVEYLGPHPLFILQRRPLSDMQNFQKTAFDFVFALVATILLSPLLLAIAAIVKLDSPGPVFFRQPRRGCNEKRFMVFKFRSMRTEMSDFGAVRQTSRNDPRVTRVGKWLRKLSLDELPQLFNVLAGDMSLVGPRPHAPQTRAGGHLLDDALADYVLRYHVKPGITGWAQVNGARGELVTVGDLERRVKYDLDYIRRWSLFFDVKIIFLTVVREIFSRHAF
ncbi:exopolysaccharide biosynthesis polyprenyl glycosylphosphotransferase [Acetobacter sacchari]|uniref:Exopolysaccharide biosynthesis polyprenyl glycosylphosphotransferase n=1 Tax=Acetobacter sacchari TaxID=2661687 RepID=A0ABS3M0R1_9PROT|nr:exopolysaccharide biosynthesis polyprenyl glycosylphosphotransferase [Acetobacter sacchari]MBO1361735.1 exopolysaccharide biosynthesis polyprenyl glycosylphosphotransferase [Acetobacter sacchari]